MGHGLAKQDPPTAAVIWSAEPRELAVALVVSLVLQH